MKIREKKSKCEKKSFKKKKFFNEESFVRLHNLKGKKSGEKISAPGSYANEKKFSE